jgi:hypothetical protein
MIFLDPGHQIAPPNQKSSESRRGRAPRSRVAQLGLSNGALDEREQDRPEMEAVDGQ